MQKTNHVIFITIDGVRPDGYAKANTPVMDSLIAQGASTMRGTTVFPPITLPVHSSLFFGVSPMQHGVVNNTFPLNPNVRNFTTVFDHLAQHKMKNMIYSSWEEFRNTYTNIGNVDLLHMEKLCDDYYNPTPESEAIYDTNYFTYTQSFADNFVKRLPNVAYLYLEMPDVYGHNYRWMSDEYVHAISTSDKAVGILMKTLKDAGLEHDVTVIITSDHGGHDKSHGKDIPEDMIIPWIAVGKGIKQGYEIQANLNILDTTVTICDLLGVTPHKSYQGRVLDEIYV